MTQKTALAKPKFVKIKDLETQRSGYNVYAKVLSAEPKTVENHEGQKVPMVDAVIGDETASAKAFFKGDNAKLIQKGNVIAIRNGVKRFIKDHISLEVDLFGRVTLEKDVTVNAQPEAVNISDAEHKLEPRKRGPPRGGNRGGPRGGDRRDRGDRGQRAPYRGDRPPRGDREDRGDRRDRGDRQDRRPRGDREERGDRPVRGTRNYDDKPRGEGRRNEGRYDRAPRDRQDRNEREPRRGGYDRDYDRRDRAERNDRPERQYRPRREYAEKREENRGDRRPITWTKLSDIMPGDDGLSLNVKVVTLERVGAGNRQKYRCRLGDSTGVANAFLPAKIDVREGDNIVLFNAKAEVVKEHIEIQLQYNQGRIQISRRAVDRVNQEFNLSEKAWVPIE